MADQYIGGENGRVGHLFKSIWVIANGIILATVVGIFVKIDSLKESQYQTQSAMIELRAEIKAQSAITTLTNEIAKNERAEIRRRLSEIERKRYSTSNDDSGS